MLFHLLAASNFYLQSSNGWNDTLEDGYKDPNAWKSGKVRLCTVFFLVTWLEYVYSE